MPLFVRVINGSCLCYFLLRQVDGAVVHLGVAVVGLLQLQVFSRLACEVHPFPFEPFDGRLLQQ